MLVVETKARRGDVVVEDFFKWCGSEILYDSWYRVAVGFCFPGFPSLVCKIEEERLVVKQERGVTFFRQSGLLAFLQVFISVVEEFEEVGGFGRGETCFCMVVFVRMVLAC